MKLTCLLYILSWKMRRAARNNPLFARRLQARTGSVLIRTADRRIGRCFVFSKGRLFTSMGGSGDADVTMTWKDASTAFEAMTSPDPLAVARAVDCGDLCLDGDLSIAQWFGLLIKAMKGHNPGAPLRSNLKVAVVGLGKMGSGLAQNIQRAGFELTVFNRTQSKAMPFVRKGAALAATPLEAASKADVLITSLMDDASIEAIVRGEHGVLAGLPKGGIHLCTTTISPQLAKALTQLHRQHGSHFVSGPVVGRPDAAQAGELLTLLGGERESVERCKRVCVAYSAANLVIGEEPCLANYAKLSVNYFAVSNMELMGQMYAYGDATKIGRQFYAQLFEASYANPILKRYAEKIQRQDFQDNVGFELSGGLKDVRLMHAASAETSGSLAYAPIIRSKMEQAVSNGWDRSDWSAFTSILTLAREPGAGAP